MTVGVDNPRGLALDVAGGKMYWTDRHLSDKIQRANLDGSEVEDLVTPATSGLAHSRRDGLALDVGAGKMYWTERAPGRIQRANLDGSDIEDVTEAGGAPYEVALDDAEGKLYWTDVNRGILRANLDGSGAELLVAMGIYDPRGIAVDGSGGAIYAVDAYPNEAKPNEIRRFNLDGTSGEVLALLGMRGALAIALDVAGGKIYWTAPNRNDPKEEAKIQRANLDGTGVEDLLTVADGLVSPQGIAVDAAAQRLYWTDQGTASIRSANLDGSDVRDLVTADDGLVNPQGIVVGERHDLLDRPAHRQDPARQPGRQRRPRPGD